MGVIVFNGCFDVIIITFPSAALLRFLRKKSRYYVIIITSHVKLTHSFLNFM